MDEVRGQACKGGIPVSVLPGWDFYVCSSLHGKGKYTVFGGYRPRATAPTDFLDESIITSINFGLKTLQNRV